MLRLSLALALVATAGFPPQAPGSIDWAQVDRAMGKMGAMQPGDVHRYAFPRSDLDVTVDGVSIKPALALGGWVAFKATGDNEAMAMGDIVLRDDEVGPVMRTLRDGGIEQTALHNHLLRESPVIMYMHIRAHGDPTHIAAAIHAALALTKTPFTAPVAPATASGPAPFDTAAIAAALGHSGTLNGIVYQVGVPRAETIREDGMVVPPAMGVATGINIQATTNGKGVTTGDFVLTAAEVNPVIQALTENGIAVTAVHSHMLTEEPRLFFMHFWGNGDAVMLARGLRAALGKTNSK
jgi:hypothetical protein